MFISLPGGDTADKPDAVVYAAVEIKEKGTVIIMTYLTWLNRSVVQTLQH